jgi:uncharacterized peroxidase-related enzyme
MELIKVPASEELTSESSQALKEVRERYGRIPSVYRAVAISSRALEGLTSLERCLGRSLDIKTREQIAICVSEYNASDYCIAAHSDVCRRLTDISPEEIKRNRDATASDPKAHAAVMFASQLIGTRGNVYDSDLAAVRAAGYSDSEILEIIALTVQCSFTNYVSNTFELMTDFPVEP